MEPGGYKGNNQTANIKPATTQSPTQPPAQQQPPQPTQADLLRHLDTQRIPIQGSPSTATPAATTLPPATNPTTGATGDAPGFEPVTHGGIPAIPSRPGTTDAAGASKRA